MIDVRPAGVQEAYRFRLAELVPDQPMILRQDNLSIVIVKRSAATVDRLGQSTIGLQDPASKRSNQPDFAANPLRSRYPDLFVSYALGTHLGCGLKIMNTGFGEVCSNATYDFAGRALSGDSQFQYLVVPEYTFSDDFTILTIWP